MTSAVIVSTARTPLAKSWKGAFNLTYGPTLGGHAVRHVHVYLLLHAGDAFHATGHQHVVFSGDDALRGQGDGLQARGAKAVDG